MDAALGSVLGQIAPDFALQVHGALEFRAGACCTGFLEGMDYDE